MWAFVRAENVAVSAEPLDCANRLEGEMLGRSFVGAYCRFYLKAPGLEPVLVADIEASRARGVPADGRVFLGWDARDTILVKRA